MLDNHILLSLLAPQIVSHAVIQHSPVNVKKMILSLWGRGFLYQCQQKKVNNPFVWVQSLCVDETLMSDILVNIVLFSATREIFCIFFFSDDKLSTFNNV